MTADRERTRRSRRNRGATARWNGRATMATVMSGVPLGGFLARSARAGSRTSAARSPAWQTALLLAGRISDSTSATAALRWERETTGCQ